MSRRVSSPPSVTSSTRLPSRCRVTPISSREIALRGSRRRGDSPFAHAMKSPNSAHGQDSRPTIHEVAVKAGVSVTSVSRVLNNRADAALEMSVRVKRAVRELNYVPNHAARRLAERQQSHNVAFLFDIPNAAVLGEMVGTGFVEAAASGVELVFIKVPPDREPPMIRKTLANLGIDGVILSPPICDDTRLRHTLSSAGIRIVAIGSDDKDLPHSTIGIDDTRAAYQLTQHLLELGHRRVGFIGGSPRHRSSARRRAGYETALLEYGLPPDPPLQWEGKYT